MPFTVQDLIVGRSTPVTVLRDESVQTALRLMIEGDYSQLPVVDRDGKAEGMITGDSIIRALNHFDLTIKEMRVFHAMTQVVAYGPEDDLFGLLDDLKNVYAVAAVDNDKKVIGIITSYDTTEYFRRRGEDMMLVEDIETMLKEYVLAAFQNASGDFDNAALDLAIQEITRANSKLRGPFHRALHQYLQTNSNLNPAIDQHRAEEAFSRHLSPTPTGFENLTLNEYIELFLSKTRWDHYKSIFDLDANSCRKLLIAVRDIRNELAHFRSEITPQKREELRFCKEWLARHQSEVASAFADSNGGLSANSSELRVGPPSDVGRIVGELLGNIYKEIRLGSFESEDIPVQLSEDSDARESRYVPLALFLQSQPMDQYKVNMSFEEIELLIGGRLAKYARQHRSWWANDSTAHVQSIQWLGAGWRVSSVNMSEERVVFTRIEDREQSYIQFFSHLLADLRASGEIPIRALSPDGQSWINITRLTPEGEAHRSVVSFSFARGGRFRVELYIDEGDKKTNKRIFDELYPRRDEISSAIGEDLSWERLDRRRASRIAAYHAGSITDNENRLTELRAWAAPTMARLYTVLRPVVLEAAKP